MYIYQENITMSQYFERATVYFTTDLSVDGYLMPNGEFRVGITGASEVLGFAKNWLGRVTRTEAKTLKALQGLGFKGLQEVGKVMGETGSQSVTTISLNDFSLLILYAAMQGKKQAIALQLSLTQMSLKDFFYFSFGKEPLSFEEKRKAFYQDFAKTIDWFKEDQQDVLVIEEHQLFLEGSFNHIE